MNGKKCIGLSVLVLVGVAGAPAAGSQVFVNPVLQQGFSATNPTNANTHSRHVYRLDGQQWEMFQRRGETIGQGSNGVNNDLSLVTDNSDLQGVKMSFSLEFDPSKGFRYQMQELVPPVGTGIRGEVIWGPGDNAQSPAPLWDQEFSGAETQWKEQLGTTSELRDFDYRDFNSIRLSSSNMTFEGFEFSSSVFGNAQFIDGDSPQWLYLGRESALGKSLLTEAWTITGHVTANSLSPTPDFRLQLVQSEFAVIPLPTGAGLAGLGLGLVALRRRR